MIRLAAAMEVDDDEYLIAISDLRKAYPNDLASALHSIDFYFLKNEFGKMRESIDRVIDKLGPDSHLYGLKAVGFSSDKKMIDALECLQLAIKTCLLYTSPSPRDKRQARMPSSA